MRIAIIGAGYVGLVSGACLAGFGHEVVCVDDDSGKLEGLRRGKVPIFEPGLADLVLAGVNAKTLSFTTDHAEAVSAADVIFVAVGTPSRRGEGDADLSYVYAAVRAIAPALRSRVVVAIKSTVPVGTGDEVDRIIRALRPDAEVAVVSNPEFLREGAAIEDFRVPDRIIVGIEDEWARTVMAEVYAPLDLRPELTLFVSRRSAELTKYAANAFLAMKVAYINEIAALSEAADADVAEIARGIGLDSRIGTRFLSPGPGYGGSCLPKDTAALVKTARDLGHPLTLVEATVAANAARKTAMVGTVVAAAGGSVRGKTVALLGLTFKPKTDDMREAPSLAIIEGLKRAGATIRAFDPEGMANAAQLTAGVTFGRDAYDAATGADVVVVVTEWPMFRALDLAQLRAAMRTPVLVDLRNLFEPGESERNGFAYTGIGRPTRSR